MSMPRVGSSRIRSVGLGDQPAGQQHLLLVAARQVAHQRVGVGGADVERLDVLLDQPGARGLRDRAQPAAGGLQREQHVVGHGQVADDALGLAVLAGEGDLAVDGVPRAAQPAPLGADRDLAGVGGVGAEEQAGQLGAARAEQAGEADDLALEELEVGGLERALAADAEGREDRRAGLGGGVGRLAVEPVEDLELAADHQLDQLELGGVGDHPLLDQRAVAQDRHPVGDRVDLVEEVARRTRSRRPGRAAGASPRRASRPRRRRGSTWARRGSGREPPRRPRGRSRPAAGRRSGGPRARRSGRCRGRAPRGSSRARRFMARTLIPPKRRGSRPSSMFSATVRLGTRLTSW